MATNIILCPPVTVPPTTIKLCDPTTVHTPPTTLTMAWYRRRRRM